MENKTDDCFIKGSSIKCLLKKKTPYKILIGLLLFVLIIIGIKFYFFKDMSWKDFLLFKFLSNETNDKNGKDNSAPDTTFGGQPFHEDAKCYIEGEDIYNGYTYTKSGTKIQINDAPLLTDCSKCNNYVYKDSSGKCANYLYDKEEQEPATEPEEWPGAGDNTGVCEPNPMPTSTTCPF